MVVYVHKCLPKMYTHTLSSYVQGTIAGSSWGGAHPLEKFCTPSAKFCTSLENIKMVNSIVH